MTTKSLQILAGSLLALGLLLVSTAAAAVSPPSAGGENLLEVYRRGLHGAVAPAARRELASIDIREGRRATPWPLAYRAADAAARWYAAEGLTALGYHADSARLRGLSPVQDRASANVASRQVIAIMDSMGASPAENTRPAQAVSLLRKAAVSLTEAMDADPSGPPTPSEPPAPPAEAPSPEAHALRAVQFAAALATEASTVGADAERLSSLCVQSLGDMAEAARGRRVAAAPGGTMSTGARTLIP